MTTNQLLNLIDDYANCRGSQDCGGSREPVVQARVAVVAAFEAQVTEIERLQREVVNRNQRALDGDLAVKVRDAELLVNDKLREQVAALAAERGFKYAKDGDQIADAIRKMKEEFK